MSFSFTYQLFIPSILDESMNNINIHENIEELHEILKHFKENYYAEATLLTHMDYIYKILNMKKINNGQYPTKKEFLLSYRNSCFCRHYIDDNDMFVLAADFFISKQGDIVNLTCSNVYYFTEFYTIERRPPESIRELNYYISRSILSIINPDFFISETPSKPVEKSKLDIIKEKIFIFTYNFKGKDDIKEDEKESCSICQEFIEDNQKCIRLDCGHYFHAQESICCENGNIFKWFQFNNSCPLCRKEV
jgi:hypothetical protein